MDNLFSPDNFVFPFRENDFDFQSFLPRRPIVKILVVVDQNIGIAEGQGFGIRRVIELIRENQDSFVYFDVDIAVTGVAGSNVEVVQNPSDDARYRSFRFSSVVNNGYLIDSYDELWCFGFAPGNDGMPDDENIYRSPYASTDEDLAVLSRWMDNGGGVLAMGDHHYLGASMCSRIPRVGTMRKWTNKQEVPPQETNLRHDTNRPQNDTQDPYKTQNPAEIPNTAERDSIPQRILWKKYQNQAEVLYPHPLLCGGGLGVIDVFPDHPHEGEIIHENEINMNNEYSFNGYSNSEYPVKNNYRPEPEVIAWASVLPDPPYNHQKKGGVKAKQFGIVGVYDGDGVNTGRVTVDSTWHHWMNLNILGLENAENNNHYLKIARYFQNCAVWLARKKQRKAMLKHSLAVLTVSGYTFEDFHGGLNELDAGSFAIDILGRETSSCLIADLSRLYIPIELIVELRKLKDVIPDRCLSCPFEELALKYVVGGIVKERISVRDAWVSNPKASIKSKKLRNLDKKGVKKGLKSFTSQMNQIGSGFNDVMSLKLKI